MRDIARKISIDDFKEESSRKKIEKRKARMDSGDNEEKKVGLDLGGKR